MRMRVGFADVVGGFLDGGMPAAIVAGRDLGITLLAVKRAAVKELLHALALLAVKPFERERHRLRFAATIALLGAVLGDDRLVMTVQSAGHDAGTDAERAG